MKNNFQFSIIISMHNSEKYLDQCITSIINQTFDFESNIQVILMDDGSYDKTKEISLKYVNKYPNNIKLLTQLLTLLIIIVIIINIFFVMEKELW